MTHPYGVDPQDPAVATAKRVAESVLAPNAPNVDRDANFPSANIEALGKEGLLGLCVDADHGGLGAAPRVFAAVTEELATA